MNYAVKHNTEASRFEVDLDGKIAHADYHPAGNNLVILHFYTPPEYRGKGIAAQIAKFILEYCRNNNLKVIPQCPYMHEYMMKHEEQDMLAD